MSRLEVWTADGLQVLEGDAATAHVLLQIVVMLKEIAALPGQYDVVAWQLADGAAKLAEPHRSNVLAAAQSLARFHPNAPEWTAPEMPLLERFRAESTAEEQLNRSLTDDAREVDRLRMFVREMRDHASGFAGTASGRAMANTVGPQIEECADIDLPGVPALVAEARAIVERMRGAQ